MEQQKNSMCRMVDKITGQRTPEQDRKTPAWVRVDWRRVTKTLAPNRSVLLRADLVNRHYHSPPPTRPARRDHRGTKCPDELDKLNYNGLKRRRHAAQPTNPRLNKANEPGDDTGML